MDAQRLKFAQQKQSEDMVEIGIGEHHARNGRLAHALARMQFRRSFDLARRSGDAPSRNHERPSSVIATCVWVRGLPWNVPALTARQFAQAQFHCGNAPPAAEPRIFTRISREFTAWIRC